MSEEDKELISADDQFDASSNDVAEEEGMVCGGQMKVLIKDVGEA